MESIPDISDAAVVASGFQTIAVSVFPTTSLSTPMSRSVTLQRSRKPLSILQYNYGKSPNLGSDTQNSNPLTDNFHSSSLHACTLGKSLRSATPAASETDLQPLKYS